MSKKNLKACGVVEETIKTKFDKQQYVNQLFTGQVDFEKFSSVERKIADRFLETIKKFDLIEKKQKNLKEAIEKTKQEFSENKGQVDALLELLVSFEEDRKS